MSEVIRVSIGSEPLQYVPMQVLKASIVRRTKSLVEFTSSWDRVAGWHPLIKSLPRIPHGTSFNLWRWCVPSAYSFRGRVIYLDSDQIVLGDIAELWGLLPADKTIACVRNAVGIFGKKKTPEPNKNQTSVMVIDAAKAMWNAPAMAADVRDGRMVYADMMQAAWLSKDQVQEIDPGWNHFGILNESTKLLHYSHVKSQPYRDPRHPQAAAWCDELQWALRAGMVTPDDVRCEVDCRHLHSHWLSVLGTA